jgi:hypothetical protein
MLVLAALLVTGCASSKEPAFYQGDAPPQLEVERWGWRASSNMFWVAEGVVKNLTDQPLEGVTAVCSFYDAGGTFRKSESGRIEKVIPPGKSVQFRVCATVDPGVALARIDFTDFMGEYLPVKQEEPRLRAMRAD